MTNNNIKQMLGRLSLKEKLSQITMFYDTAHFIENGRFSKAKAEEILGKNGIGCVYIPMNSNLSKSELWDFVSDLQKYLINETEFGIPAIVVSESLHGVMYPDMTAFPQSIGISCSWDEDLVQQVAECISEEAESVGVSQVLAPDLDVARDPRWGRVEETFGEDPYLTARLGAGYTRGMRKSGKVAATLKHFVAHGEPENGINLSPISIGERKLREVYLPAFEASIKEDPISVMPAYHELDGKPCHASKWMLTDLLRDELGFEGYTVSDFGAVGMLCTFHRTAKDVYEAGYQALKAGVDLEAPGKWGYGETLLPLLESGQITESDIDKAVERILYAKRRLGLAERDYSAEYIEPDALKNNELALKAAEESIVLLKNNGILPLSEELGKIAVIGPNAAVTRYGDYSSKTKGVTLLDGLKERFGGKIRYSKGCSIYRSIEGGTDDAVKLANESDVVILALGGSDMMIGGVGWGEDGSINDEYTCGEGFDSHDLRLPPVQLELAKRVMETGKPIILLLQDGRPCAIPEIYDGCAAIIQAWYAGQQGGTAMAEILCGSVNPSGRLTMTIPKHVGQVPLFYDHKPSARGSFYKSFGSPEAPGRAYTILDPYPYFEFGYGLSYTTFEYSGLKAEVADNGTVTVSVNVKNTGDMAGKEVVQLYINDVVSSVTTPVKALKGFKKIFIEAGEAREVRFTLGFDELCLINDEMAKAVEEGEFEVIIENLKETFYLSKEQCDALLK